MNLLGMTPVSDEEKAKAFGSGSQGAGASEGISEGTNDGVNAPDPSNTPPVTEPAKFTLEVFNQTFGTTFDKDDVLKDVISKGMKFSEVEKQIADLKAKNDELLAVANKSINPRSYFSSDDAYLREQLILKNKDNAELVKHLTDLTPTKIQSLTDADALKYSIILDTPNLDGGIAGAEELLQEKYGYIDDPESMTRVQKNQLMLDAKQARARLNSLYEGITIPDATSWEGATQRVRDSWSKPAQDLVDGINELQLSDGLNFVVDPSSKEGILEEVLAELSRNRVDLNEEALRNVAGIVRTRLVERNLDKIISHVSTTAAEKAKAELRAQVHNDTSLNNTSGPSGTVDINAETLKKL